MEETDSKTSYNRVRNFFLNFNNGREDIIIFHVKVFLSVYFSVDGEIHCATQILGEESIKGLVDYAIYRNTNNIDIDYRSLSTDWNYISKGELLVELRDIMGNNPRNRNDAEKRLEKKHLPYIREALNYFAIRYNMTITEE